MSDEWHKNNAPDCPSGCPYCRITQLQATIIAMEYVSEKADAKISALQAELSTTKTALVKVSKWAGRMDAELKVKDETIAKLRRGMNFILAMGGRTHCVTDAIKIAKDTFAAISEVMGQFKLGEVIDEH